MLLNKGKKYNTSTKGFKIDIYYKGVYVYSTDIYKTCRAAKDNFIRINPNIAGHTIDIKQLKANFDKICG